MTTHRRTRRVWPLFLVAVGAFAAWVVTGARDVMRALDEYERGRG